MDTGMCNLSHRDHAYSHSFLMPKGSPHSPEASAGLWTLWEGFPHDPGQG